MTHITVAGMSAKEHLPVKNILIAIDDCEDTSIASPIMERTLELASAFSSKVWILHIVPNTRQSSPFNIDSRILRREIAAELCNEHDFLQHLAQCMRDRGIDAKALLVEGATIRTIQKESERLDIDLIVLGCHKHGQLYGVLMEFTEEGLLSKCSRPVMFIPIQE
jgi:nucleotide-binding universal stress UspA family protein